MMDKPAVQDVVRKSLQRQERELRDRMNQALQREDELKKEAEQLEEEKRGNLPFRSTDESIETSLNGSQIDVGLKEKVKEMDVKIQRWSDRIDKRKVVNVDCGQLQGDKFLLRGFHDRFYSEPRGRVQSHQKKTAADVRGPHKDLKAMANDPEILVISQISCRPARRFMF